MLARALIVLLVVLNLGVAAWWMARDEAVPVVTAAEPPAGAARLQLLREVVQDEGAESPPTVAATASATGGDGLPEPEPQAAASPSEADPPVASAATPAAAQTPLQCYAIGPFSDEDKLAAARGQLQARVARLGTREVAPANAARREWRVWLPQRADRAAAQAMVDRITAAGFSDYYIVASGEEANSIALGLYGSEESARRHLATLHAAGFTEVRADALGDAPQPVTWIDVASTTPLAAADGSALGAERVEPLDCATLPAAPATASR